MNRGVLRTLIRVGMLAGVAATVAAPASAQIVQSVSFGVGMFSPRGFDIRAEGDVWVANLTQPVIPGTNPPITGSLLFDISDFRSIPVFGEWHVGFTDRIEVGVSAAYTNQKVRSVYRDLVNGHGTASTFDDTEIAQDLRLQTIPVTGAVRFLGGRPGHFQPYAGIGVAAVIFKYSEVGEFVDTADWSTIYAGRYTTSGVAFGPVLIGGARMPLGGDVYALTAEARYQWAVGKTGGFDQGFLGEKLDLSGWGLTGGFLIRF